MDRETSVVAALYAAFSQTIVLEPATAWQDPADVIGLVQYQNRRATDLPPDVLGSLLGGWSDSSDAVGALLPRAIELLIEGQSPPVDCFELAQVVSRFFRRWSVDQREALRSAVRFISLEVVADRLHVSEPDLLALFESVWLLPDALDTLAESPAGVRVLLLGLEHTPSRQTRRWCEERRDQIETRAMDAHGEHGQALCELADVMAAWTTST